MPGSGHISRREFITLTTAAVGTFIGAVIGLPAIAYVIGPALQTTSSDAWIPLGKLESFQIGLPTLTTFTRSQVNGWEKTVDSYGVFVLRKSQTEVAAFSNVCTHLGCRVNWHADQQQYICPCHNAHFDINGNIVSGPPPRPLTTYATRVENGLLSIHFLEG
ncbi:MAG: ubiquinol-cytochrome c reductase iron-sulfur subunit [Anaerolineales bacterium]